MQSLPPFVDPDVSIRVHGLDEGDKVVANVGDDRTLKCSAISMLNSHISSISISPPTE